MGSVAISEEKGVCNVTKAEAVIKDLEKIKEVLRKDQTPAIDAAIALIMCGETEAEIEGSGKTWVFVCGECRSVLQGHAKFCAECGRRVNWT